MELALITAQQVAVLFLLIGTGMVAVKTGVLKLENKQALSNLLVYIVVPAMVVNSYRMEFSAQILRNLLAAFGMSVLSVLLGTVITLLLTARKTGSRMPIFRFACIFSNAAYMGFPLISALFGSEGLLYASAYVTVFNILLWTFVRPALYEKEVRGARIAFALGTVMFYLGVAVGYFLVFPITMRFLFTYQLSSTIHNQLSLDSYMDNFLMLNLVMGLVFELPLLAWTLSAIGILRRKFFSRYRRHAVVVLLVLAAVITPTGDPFTLMIVFLPLYLLFEVSALIVKK